MDLYEVLGLQRGASLGDIKRAYRRLARRFHPDINPGDRAAEARFRQILFAYETLGDEGRRRRYDQTGTIDQPPLVMSYGFEGFDFSVEVTSAHDASTFGDLFGDILRGAGAPHRVGEAARGSDLHAAVSVTFLESIQGIERHVTVTRSEACRTCSGVGAVRTAEAACPQCAGVGAIRSTRGHMVFAKPCAYCGGSGQQQRAACRTCGGLGVEPRVESVAVRVPAGATAGMQVRVPGKGHAGPHQGPAGDLYVRVDVDAHPLFRREGDDVHLVVPVAVHEAALGARIEIPTPNGPARLRVPPGTQSGHRFRLHDRGAPSPRTGVRGDLVAEVRIVLPGIVDERTKELLREFGRINHEDVRKDLAL
jgi:molecular chaperone DnaJ